MTRIIGPDIAYYQDDNETPQGIDFDKMRGETEFVIIRAGQNLWIDPDFDINWNGAWEAQLYRGSYWFYDSRADPVAQAQKWVAALAGDLGELPLFADFEDKYNGPFKGWRNWKLFLEELRRLVMLHEIQIYTAFYYWKDSGPYSDPTATEADRQWFKQFRLWIANFDATTPAIPLPWSATDWDFWQFQDNTRNTAGDRYGVESTGIDLNYFNGDSAAFHARFPNGPAPAPPPQAPIPIHTHEGVEVYRVTRFGAPLVVHVIDLTRVELWVSGKSDDFQQVRQTVEKNGASGGVNGGGWVYGKPDAVEIWKSRGTLIQPIAVDGRPWVGFTEDRKVVFGTGVPPANVRDAVGYNRYLGQAGVFNERYRSSTVKDARTFSGRRRDGRFVVCVAEGNDLISVTYGLTYYEQWQVLSEFDVETGGNHDGGTSSTVVNKALSPAPLLKTSDPDYAYVINAILFRGVAVGETPPPPPPAGGTMDRYRLITEARPRSIASMTSNDSAPNAPAGTEFDSDVTQVDSITASHPTMVQAKSGPYTGKWFPLVYLGTEYARRISTAPTPDPGIPTLKHTIETFSDGSIKVDGQPYP